MYMLSNAFGQFGEYGQERPQPNLEYLQLVRLEPKGGQEWQGNGRGRPRGGQGNALTPPQTYNYGRGQPQQRNYGRSYKPADQSGSSESLHSSSDSGVSTSWSPTPNKHQFRNNEGQQQGDHQTNYRDQEGNNNKAVKRHLDGYHHQPHHYQGYQNQRQFRRQQPRSPHSFTPNPPMTPNFEGHYQHQAPKRRFHQMRPSPLHHPHRNQHYNGYHNNHNYHNNRRLVEAYHYPPPQPTFVLELYPNPDDYLNQRMTMEPQLMRPPVEQAGEMAELSESVWSTYVNMRQTLQTFQKKMLLWKDFYLIIKMLNCRHHLFVVGSTMSGFGGEKSDVDMCLVVSDQEVDQRHEAIGHLGNLHRQLHKCDFVAKMSLIHAKVPILKFMDFHRQLEIDLNCNNFVGIRNTHLLYAYSQMDWRVRPLVVTVKQWAQVNDINDAKKMTISSYSLTLMVIHYLQCGCDPPVLPCLHSLYPEKFNPDSDVLGVNIHEKFPPFNSLNTQTLGELFIGFLRYYDEFDFQQDAISVRLATKLPVRHCQIAKSRKNEPHQWKNLCIEEPFDYTNTARSVFDAVVFDRIKSVFRWSRETIEKTKDLASIMVGPGAANNQT